LYTSFVICLANYANLLIIHL